VQSKGYQLRTFGWTSFPSVGRDAEYELVVSWSSYWTGITDSDGRELYVFSVFNDYADTWRVREVLAGDSDQSVDQSNRHHSRQQKPQTSLKRTYRRINQQQRVLPCTMSMLVHKNNIVGKPSNHKMYYEK